MENGDNRRRKSCYSAKNRITISKEPDYVKKIDDFIEHYYNGDYAIKEEAFRIPCGFKYKGARDEYNNSLGHFLHTAISNYLLVKDNSEKKEQAATECLLWITHAHAVGVIVEGKGFIGKIKKYEERIEKLSSDNARLKEAYCKLKNENRELHKFLNQFDKRGIIEG